MRHKVSIDFQLEFVFVKDEILLELRRVMEHEFQSEWKFVDFIDAEMICRLHMIENRLVSHFRRK